jgi:hypothetical protein
MDTHGARSTLQSQGQRPPRRLSFDNQATRSRYLGRPSKAHHRQLQHVPVGRGVWRSSRVCVPPCFIASSADIYKVDSLLRYDSRQSKPQESDPDATIFKSLFWQLSRSNYPHAARPIQTKGPSFSTSAMMHSVSSLPGCSTAISGAISTNSQLLSWCLHRRGISVPNTISRLSKT